MSQPAPAASVILLRPSGDGLSVFLVQRHQRSGFMPSMWVFPGGRVEEADAWVAGAGGDAGRALRVCGARETFEEAGIWLGTGDLPVAERGPLARGERPLADLLDVHGARLDLDRLHPWARWVTPEVETRRFDATFFVACVEDARGAHDDHETVDSAWLDPRAVLAAGARYPLAPPTWCLLAELATFPGVDAVLSAAAGRDLRPVQPVPHLDGAGLVMRLPGDPDHPEPPRAGLPRRLTLGPEGWVATP